MKTLPVTIALHVMDIPVKNGTIADYTWVVSCGDYATRRSSLEIAAKELVELMKEHPSPH